MKKLHSFFLTFLCCFVGNVLFAANPYDADIVVAADGSGNYTKIQEAINAVPSNSDRRTVIYIKRGTYNTEKLIIPANKKNITMIGESRDETIISYHMYDCSNAESANKCPADAYELWKDNADLVRTSATLTIQADGFIAENLTLQNTAGPVGQALAITVTGDKGIYRNCNFFGYQDTIYLWTAGKRSYFENCLIGGRTDYIYGAGIALFESCEIRSWGGGWITAPSTPQSQAYGYVFNKCKVTYAGDSPSPSDNGQKFALGRPWHEYPKVAWLYCEMSEMINPLGWPTKWNMSYADTSADLHLYEYKNTGAGADMSGRANWAGLRAMTDTEALNYTVQKVMAGSDNWDPTAAAPIVKSYTWTGSANNSWLDANNWNPVGVPANGDVASVDISATLNADGNTFAADLTLNENAKLNVTANSTANYLALAGGEIEATVNSSLAGKMQTKSATTINTTADLDIQAAIIGVHDITKSGNGKLILSADNSSYSGTILVTQGSVEAKANNSLGVKATEVKSGGTLIIGSDNAVNVKAALKIETGGKVQLDKPVVLQQLYFDGVMQQPGVYNATTSSAYLTGSGNITVGRPTMFLWAQTESKRWGTAANYTPALLPLAGDTVTVELEMEADATPYAATILLKKGGLRLVGNAVSTGDIIMSNGTKINYATGGVGFSLDAKVKLEGDITLQMSGSAEGNTMTLLGTFEGSSKITAHNYTNAPGMVSTAILNGDNSNFDGTWDLTKASRGAGSSAVFEGMVEGAFGRGTIDVSNGNKVAFSHAKSASSDNVLKLASGTKAIMNTNVEVGKLVLNGIEYTSGTFNATTHPEYFEGTGTLTVSVLSSISDNEIVSDMYFDGKDLIILADAQSLKIFDLQGKCVKTHSRPDKKTAIDLPSGAYLAVIKANNETQSLKFVIK
ncbi:pectinesterase family protein [Dysgonomonas sp. 520]|uniref:pectinesterase family protein n=1 Tax=Dysgonomonas sp. 520 TaxID=2302931 RepID=UPI0013D3F970|nr:pectinesterase family protein [Dysgonomonas sp. 520]NDW08704.1 T9SS C-terminal target domain-containing protein [Dysgonomonas sp. 520]